MDYRQNLDSKQINIYGHNSTKYNPPFKILENYLNKEYYDLMFKEDIFHIVTCEDVGINLETTKICFERTINESLSR